MKLWMSRSAITHQHAFWSQEPDVGWNERGEPRIGFALMGTPAQICDMINIHKLFPSLEIPPGEMAEVEVVEMEHGYYIGFIE